MTGASKNIFSSFFAHMQYIHTPPPPIPAPKQSFFSNSPGWMIVAPQSCSTWSSEMTLQLSSSAFFKACVVTEGEGWWVNPSWSHQLSGNPINVSNYCLFYMHNNTLPFSLSRSVSLAHCLNTELAHVPGGRERVRLRLFFCLNIDTKGMKSGSAFSPSPASTVVASLSIFLHHASLSTTCLRRFSLGDSPRGVINTILPLDRRGYLRVFAHPPRQGDRHGNDKGNR